MSFKFKFSSNALISSISGAALLAISSVPAGAVLIQFENPDLVPPLIGDNFTIESALGATPSVQGGQYDEDGFRLRALGGFDNGVLLDDNDRFSVHGSNQALSGGTGYVGVAGNVNQFFNSVEGPGADPLTGTTELSFIAGGGFDLTAIDLAANQTAPGTISVTFTGTKTAAAGGGTVIELVEFQHDGANFALFTHNFFNDFTQLETVTWINAVGGIGVHQFDNINVAESQQTGGTDPIPEPGALALLATGLLGLGLFTRRRRYSL